MMPWRSGSDALLSPQQEFKVVRDLKSCQDLEAMREMALLLLGSWQRSQSLVLELMKKDLPVMTLDDQQGRYSTF